MIEIKYIYFEEVIVVGSESINGDIRNENVLLLEPKTNSNGIWSFRNISKQKINNIIIDQYWINLERFNDSISNNDPNLRIIVHKVMKMINDKYE